MKQFRPFSRRLILTRSESVALLVIASLYVVGFTWSHVQETTESFDPAVYAELDSLIAAGGIVPVDTLPKPGRKEGEDSLETEPLRDGIGLLDVNTAGLAKLMDLPGIGPALASRIIDYRTRHGHFKAPDELIRVKGIGPAKMQRILPLITAN